MCFDGKAKCSFTCTERYTEGGLKVTFFDMEWKRLPFKRHYPQSEQSICKPINYDKMVKFAETLSKDIPFVRIDFYDVKGHLYFGEITFYPGSGMEEFEPKHWDDILGGWLMLPSEKSDGI